MKQRVVLASGNRGKLEELRQLLEPLALDLVSQGELGIAAPDEPYSSFVENALHKARHAARQAGFAAIADDSGLTVDALNGAPGVHSARFAGDNATDADNNALLIRRLRALDPDADGGFAAAFYSTLVFVGHAEDPAPLIAVGRWRGVIRTEPEGSNGFGYDPLFYVPELGMTAAQLPAADKNRLSHRGQAMARLLELLRSR